MKKKNICFRVSSYEREKFTGGKEKFTGIIIDYFVNSNNFLIDIICNSTNIKTTPAGINELINFIDKKDFTKKYDLIFSNAIVTPLKFLNADIKATYLHDFSLKQLRKDFDLFKKFKYYIFPKHLKRIKEQEENIKQFDIIFTVSQKIKDDIVTNLNVMPEKIKVIYPGLDDSYKKTKIKIYPNKTFKFGLSATNFKGKGGYIFLKALKILKKYTGEFKAIIIISKPKKRFCIKLLIKFMGLDKQVELREKTNNLEIFYEEIDCLCLPSLVETFGMVTLEAIGSGIPVIVSNNCGCVEIINHLDNGLIFEHKNSKNLAEMMLKLVNDKGLYEKISNNARKTADNFSWNSVYDAILKSLYGEIQ